MSHVSANRPLPMQPPPEGTAPDLAPLLDLPLAAPTLPIGLPQAVRQRLAGRLAASLQADAAMVTTRRRQAPAQTLAAGVTARTLYRAQPAATLRPGEPLWARLIELAPGAVLDLWPAGAETLHREWLVLDGCARLDGQWLSLRDYHVVPAGQTTSAVQASDLGALLFLRESRLAALPGEQAFTVRDADAGWPTFAPGVQRRVLWQRDGQAALLYFAQPGAQVPQHRHGHDEECLMMQGELFLNDLLLQAGDYQLAPAGSGHRITQTDTGVVIYAHGDLDLQFVA